MTHWLVNAYDLSFCDGVFAAQKLATNAFCYYNFTILLIFCGKSNEFVSGMILFCSSYIYRKERKKKKKDFKLNLIRDEFKKIRRKSEKKTFPETRRAKLNQENFETKLQVESRVNANCCYTHTLQSAAKFFLFCLLI